jgi:hypothetical protein
MVSGVAQHSGAFNLASDASILLVLSSVALREAYLKVRWRAILLASIALVLLFRRILPLTLTVRVYALQADCDCVNHSIRLCTTRISRKKTGRPIDHTHSYRHPVTSVNGTHNNKIGNDRLNASKMTWYRAHQSSSYPQTKMITSDEPIDNTASVNLINPFLSVLILDREVVLPLLRVKHDLRIAILKRRDLAFPKLGKLFRTFSLQSLQLLCILDNLLEGLFPSHAL